MKSIKTYFPAIACALALATASCSNDNGGNTLKTDCTVANLVTDSFTGVSSASECTYSLFFNYDEGNVTLSTTQLLLGSSISAFTANPAKYSPLTTHSAAIEGVSGNVNNNPLMPLTDFKAKLADVYASGIEESYLMSILFLQYNVGSEYKVSTFPVDAFYRGTTQSTYPSKDGSTVSYTNEGATYRLKFSMTTNKANLSIFNARFAEQMPQINLIVEGLDVKYVNGKYKITGSNITPGVIEGNNTVTPNPSYPFNSISIEAANAELTDIKVEYTVAGSFQGAFSGTCLKIDQTDK